LAGLTLALLQQRGLQQRMGRLLWARPAANAAGVLELRYSRSVDADSLAASIQLEPEVPLRATAEGATVQLHLSQPYRINGPLKVTMAGQDQQGHPLSKVHFQWDPRPFVVALVSSSQGERLELGWPEGPWQPLTPWEPTISSLLPLRDGRGVVYGAAVDDLSYRNWLVTVEQPSVLAQHLPVVLQPAKPPQHLPAPTTLYSHFSSSSKGQLLIQGVSSAALEQPAEHPPFLRLLHPGEPPLVPWLQGGQQFWRRWEPLDDPTDGPAELLPGGDGLVLPGEDGLFLVSLPPLPPQRHLLPGNRALKTFCGAGQRAVVLEHQPEYIKTLELLRPGLSPELVWEGEAAVLAVTCDETAERIWLLTVDGILHNDQLHQDILLLEVRPGHGVVGALALTDYGLSPTPALHYDPVTHRLLTVLERMPGSRREALLISLPATGQHTPPQLHIINKPMERAFWMVRS